MSETATTTSVTANEVEAPSSAVNESPKTKGGGEPKREAFGNRHLTSDKNVFDFNAWQVEAFSISLDLPLSLF